MRARGCLAALTLVLLAAVATAQAQGTLVAVAAGDAAEGQAITGLASTLAYFDANSNGRLEGQDPTEPLYVDVDQSRSASYGDVRLSSFADLAAGTLVDVAHGDVGRPLTVVTGWIASTPQGAWYVDGDGDRQVGAGDVRLIPSFGTRVAAGDADARTGLQHAQLATSSLARIGFSDRDSDGLRDLAEPLYFDLDASGSAGSGRVNAGDLRLTAVEAAAAPATGGQSGSATSGQGGDGAGDGTDDAEEGDAGSGGSRWGTPETILFILGMLNLAGLVVVYRLAGGGQRFR